MMLRSEGTEVCTARRTGGRMMGHRGAKSCASGEPGAMRLYGGGGWVESARSGFGRALFVFGNRFYVGDVQPTQIRGTLTINGLSIDASSASSSSSLYSSSSDMSPAQKIPLR